MESNSAQPNRSFLITAIVAGGLIQMFHALLLTNTAEVLGAASAIMPVVILAIAVLLVWYSRSCAEKGWLS